MDVTPQAIPWKQASPVRVSIIFLCDSLHFKDNTIVEILYPIYNPKFLLHASPIGLKTSLYSVDRSNDLDSLYIVYKFAPAVRHVICPLALCTVYPCTSCTYMNVCVSCMGM